MAVTLRNTVEAIAEDCRCNAFFKTRCVVIFYRIVHYLACRSAFTLVAGAPLIVLYIVLCDWLMGIEIPVKTKIGKGLALYHGTGLVINGYTVIGDYCTLRHGVTIGNTIRKDGTIGGVPTIGDHVEFGAHSVVLGEISVGHRARIGAGAVVLSDVPDGYVAVGVPARILDNGKEPK
ncbi:colanic acid biosynthesis acetyltransferase [Burkholderia sp. MSh2]|uniref:Serine acetyltransferase n=1 Tax=Burkholderia paludis TaxID=1506587 RepID=A0A6J5E174_9BURK|nr:MULTISPECIES: serine acetyltransferase [Burkholderia]KEZ02582.1 colanic acid biosynthesis acetyltransferase [Burkholderia sp. MSh2]KFG98020.1 colanic acid biosynthesis acetyltransferase [Burkholderia paludis]CAB3760168.1 Serine acetyltransferase [Burkholderia paludis]VWC05440.1 colanic acid biosynthesis acetyltransferase [Burkholderia paludis]